MTVSSVPNFDRGKPFYPLVMNYLTLLVGFKELAIRGLLGKPSLDAALGKIGGIADASAEKIDELRKGLSKLSGPLELKSEFSGHHITFDIDDISREIAQNSSYLAAFLMQSAGSVMVLAHEFSKHRPWHDSGPPMGIPAALQKCSSTRREYSFATRRTSSTCLLGSDSIDGATPWDPTIQGVR